MGITPEQIAAIQQIIELTNSHYHNDTDAELLQSLLDEYTRLSHPPTEGMKEILDLLEGLASEDIEFIQAQATMIKDQAIKLLPLLALPAELFAAPATEVKK